MLGTALVVAVETLRAQGVLRVRVALAAYLVVLAFTVAAAPRRVLRPLIFFAVLSAGLTAIGVATDALSPPGPDLRVIPLRAVALLAGCAVLMLFVVTEAPDEAPVSAPSARTDWKWGLVVFAGAFVLLAAYHASGQGDFDVGLDEIIYVLQSRWLHEPGFGATYDSAIVRQAQLPFTFVHHGQLYGQYPPGWPFAISLFDRLGLFSYTGAFLGALSVLLCFAIARERLGLVGGLVSAALLLCQPWFLSLHRGLMSHELTIACALLSVWLVMRASRAETHRGIWLLLAGLAAGWAIAARPLTGVGILAGVACWMLMQNRRLARFAIDLLFVACGVAIPVLGMMRYNTVATGDPFRFGYIVVHGRLHELGFGLRGFARGLQFQFTPALSLQTVTARMQDMVEQAIGFALFLPVVALSLARRVQARWWLVVPMLMLPAAYLFYFANSYYRMYVEVIPFAIIACAALLLRSRLAGRFGLAALVAIAIVGDGLILRQLQVFAMPANVGAAVRSVAERAKHERLLVLVDTLGSPHAMLWQFFALGGTPRDSRPLVFYSGPADSLIATRFRDRVPLQVRWAGPNVAPTVQEVHRDARPSTSN